MPKVKTSELIGPALDWTVAKCEGLLDQWGVCAPAGFRPSTDWVYGGPIIERLFNQGLRLHPAEYMTGIHNKGLLVASLDSPNGFWFGPTPLIAAMRCYIASKLGDFVEIPDELL